MAASRRISRTRVLGLSLAAAAIFSPCIAASAAISSSPFSHTVSTAKENGSFDIPTRSRSTTVWQGQNAEFDLDVVIPEEARESLDMTSVQLSVVPGGEGKGESAARVAADRKSVTLPLRGEWAVKDHKVTFTPESGAAPGLQAVNVQIRNKNGELSRPFALRAAYPFAPYRAVNATEGVTAKVPLDVDTRLVDPESIRLVLRGMPPGTAVHDDGQSLVVPGEGTWRVVDGTDVLQFSPLRDRLGEQPTPVYYEARDRQGKALGPSRVSLEIPVIADVVRSSPYGDVVEFDLTSFATNISLGTLELVPYTDSSDAQVSQNGATVNVANQGVWRLDRAAGKLYFTPLSPSVTDVTPMGVRGKDADGRQSSIAPVRVGYPQVSSRYRSFTWGSTATFTPLMGSINVQHRSFAFVGTDMPTGTTVSSDGTQMKVPSEGTWKLDSATLNVTFTPVKNLKKNPTPAAFSVEGLYAGNQARGVLNAQYSDQVPVGRDDEVSTSDTSAPLVIDVLANDTPASASQALDASSLQLRSALATNIPDLVAGTGHRLVIPDQGVFQVTDAGAVEFIPASGFRGKTKPVDYIVQDKAGLRTTARIVVEVDTRATSARTNTDSGVNSLLGQLMPENAPTFSMFASVTTLLCFTGVVSLWVGRRMERGSTE